MYFFLILVAGFGFVISLSDVIHHYGTFVHTCPFPAPLRHNVPPVLDAHQIQWIHVPILYTSTLKSLIRVYIFPQATL